MVFIYEASLDIIFLLNKCKLYSLPHWKIGNNLLHFSECANYWSEQWNSQELCHTWYKRLWNCFAADHLNLCRLNYGNDQDNSQVHPSVCCSTVPYMHGVYLRKSAYKNLLIKSRKFEVWDWAVYWICCRLMQLLMRCCAGPWGLGMHTLLESLHTCCERCH